MINTRMMESQIIGQFTGCVQVEGRNAFWALVLLTLRPGDKPLHRLNLSLNKVRATFSADALTARFLLYPALLFLNSACRQLNWLLVIYGQWELNAWMRCVSANCTLIARGVGLDGSVTLWTTGQHPLRFLGNKAEGTFRRKGWRELFPMAWRLSSVIIRSRNRWNFSCRRWLQQWIYFCLLAMIRNVRHFETLLTRVVYLFQAESWIRM